MTKKELLEKYGTVKYADHWKKHDFLLEDDYLITKYTSFVDRDDSMSLATNLHSFHAEKWEDLCESMKLYFRGKTLEYPNTEELLKNNPMVVHGGTFNAYL